MCESTTTTNTVPESVVLDKLVASSVAVGRALFEFDSDCGAIMEIF